MFSPVARIVFVVGLRTLASIVLAQQPAEVVLTAPCSASGLVGYDYKVFCEKISVILDVDRILVVFNCKSPCKMNVQRTKRFEYCNNNTCTSSAHDVACMELSVSLR